MRLRPAVLFVSVAAVLVVGFAAAKARGAPVVTRWNIAGNFGADSVVDVLAKRIGGAPDTLGSCGSRRLRIVYVNAPIDLPLVVERKRSAHRVDTRMDSGDGDFHDHVAQVIAATAWSSGARNDSIDTVTVKLVQKEKGGPSDEMASSYS